MPRLNVRCCCQPQKILGTLEVPDNVIAHGHRFHVQLYDHVFFPPRGVSTPPAIESIEIREIILHRTTEVARKYSMVPSPPDIELAVYSDDRSIEFWRKVPGFIEGDEVPH